LQCNINPFPFRFSDSVYDTVLLPNPYPNTDPNTVPILNPNTNVNTFLVLDTITNSNPNSILFVHPNTNINIFLFSNANSVTNSPDLVSSQHHSCDWDWKWGCIPG